MNMKMSTMSPCLLKDPNKQFQCDKFGDTTENEGGCSRYSSVDQSRLRACADCAFAMPKERCNILCLEETNDREERGCCTYDPSTKYCYWNTSPLINTTLGFTSVLCRKGIEGDFLDCCGFYSFKYLGFRNFCTHHYFVGVKCSDVERYNAATYASECQLCPRRNKAWCSSDCKWDKKTRRCFKHRKLT